jgi:branched-chain amino acid transport system ATP-binding protein
MAEGDALVIEGLHAWYARSHVLQGVSLRVGQGEIVSLIGRNGAGKSTTMKSVMGLLPKVKGSVKFNGVELLNLPAHKRFEMGLAYVPEERRIVPGLTVLENLRLGIIASPLKSREEEIIQKTAETFPRLKERLNQIAVTLSGGEQQMLAIARALAADPKMIMLDEPSEGIMPLLVDEMFELFASIRQSGKTILLVEQNVELALNISDRAYVMDQGLIAHHDDARTLLADQSIQERYCSI